MKSAMDEPARVEDVAAPKARGKGRGWARALLRAVHRDAGYLAVGLTVVYAASGLAVNHIADWDPNFVNRAATHELGPLAGADEAIAAEVGRRLGITERPRDVYRESPELLDVIFEKRTLHVSQASGHVVDEGQKPRFLLRVANWLHLNRGKKAWTWIADAYAAALLGLAASGMFMIAGKKGLLGRGGLLVLAGIAVPVAYVTLSGGP